MHVQPPLVTMAGHGPHIPLVPTPSRAARLLDLLALALVLAGAAVGVSAWLRLREISAWSYQNPGPRSMKALAEADFARYQGYAGLVLVAAGIGVGVYAARRARREARLSS